jgi:hypothetical protein
MLIVLFADAFCQSPFLGGETGEYGEDIRNPIGCNRRWGRF